MLKLTIVFGPVATQWSFLFKEDAGLAAALDKFKASGEIGDDFGQLAKIDHAEVKGQLVEDMDKIVDGLAHNALTEHRVRARMGKIASADPLLQTALQMQNLRAGSGGQQIINMHGTPRA